MAFNKRLWKGRQGTGLNKFSINGATPVTVINQPDSVTEQGDALSAGNLNDLEDRIYDAFDDIADGTQIVGKATADASGNVITATYETKADASDLKSAIDNNSQRIENLEVAVSGSLVQTNVLTDPPSMANVRTITNANEILPWAILKRVGARAVAWNQLRTTGSGSVAITNQYGVGANEHTLTIYGHKYFVSFEARLKSDNAYTANSAFKMGDPSKSEFVVDTSDMTSDWKYYKKTGVLTKDASGTDYFVSYFQKVSLGTELLSMEYRNLMIIDMTVMGLDSLISDGFRALFPASYYAPDTGHIIPLNPSAFKVVGKNRIHDIESTLSTTLYQPILRGKVYRFKPSTQYALSFKANGSCNVYFPSDWVSGNRYHTITQGQNTIVFTTTASIDESFQDVLIPILRLNSSIGTGITFTDVQLEIGSSPTAYEAYKETTIDTSFTSDYLYVNEDCHDYSENVLVNGVMRREEHIICNSKTFNGASSEVWTPYGYGGFGIAVSDVKQSANNTVVGNVSANGFTAESYADMSSNARDMACAIHFTTKAIIFYVASITSEADWRTWLSTHPLTVVYEKDTPLTPTYADPIPNFPCEDGTTVTAITPQTELVNAIDVPSTIAYETRITA